MRRSAGRCGMSSGERRRGFSGHLHNTMHKVEAQIREACALPLLHIADATADALLTAGVRKTALLGTVYTMTQAFYRDRLTARGIEVLTPEAADREMVNGVIYKELCRGAVSPASRER